MSTFLGPYQIKDFEDLDMLTNLQTRPIDFDFTSSEGGINLTDNILPSGAVIVGFVIVVKTAFDQAATVTVGDSIDPDRYSDASEVDLEAEGMYTINAWDKLESNAQPRAYFSFASSTVGEGTAFIITAEAPA